MNLHEHILMNQLAASSLLGTKRQSATHDVYSTVQQLRKAADVAFDRDADLRNRTTLALSRIRSCKTCGSGTDHGQLLEDVEYHGAETRLLLELLSDMLTHIADVQLRLDNRK